MNKFKFKNKKFNNNKMRKYHILKPYKIKLD